MHERVDLELCVGDEASASRATSAWAARPGLTAPRARLLSADERARMRRWLEVDVVCAIRCEIAEGDDRLGVVLRTLESTRTFLDEIAGDLALLVSDAGLLVRRAGVVTVTTDRALVVEPETARIFRGVPVKRRRLRRAP